MKILLAISGGVDSALAAALLKQDGHEVHGMFMQVAAASPQDAQAVADKMDIPLHVLNLREEFQEIIDYFCCSYRDGLTPNPCAVCNPKLKFGKLFELVDSLGLDAAATGHYAQIAPYLGRPALTRATNRPKDQTYALFGLPSNRLGQLIFPLGTLPNKEHVRQEAKRIGLTVHDKPDSQDICFLPEGNFVDLLRKRCPEAMRPGNIRNLAGDILGQHQGYGQYTIGQRRGLGVASSQPLYVTQIDPETADVFLGTREESCSQTLIAQRANWQQPTPAADENTGTFRAIVQVRYNHRGNEASVRLLENDKFEVTFDQPIHALTPGQAAVVYHKNTLLGGGWIQRPAL